MTEHIGAVSFLLTLDRRQFDSDLQKLASTDRTLPVGLKINPQEMREQLRQVRMPAVKVGIDLDTQGLEAKLAKLGVDRTLSLRVEVDDRRLYALNKHFSLKEQHHRQLQRYFDGKPLTVRVNDAALVKLERMLVGLERSRSVSVVATADAKALRVIEDRLKGLEKTRATRVDIDAASLDKSISAAHQKIENWAKQKKTVQVEVEAKEKPQQIAKVRNPQTIQAQPSETQNNKVSEGLAKSFEKTIGDSIKTGFKSAAKGDLMGVLMTPFKAVGGLAKNVFTGVGLGIGEEVSRDLAKGLSSGLADELAPIVGSVNDIGKEISKSLVSGLLDALGKDAEPVRKAIQDAVGAEKIAVEVGSRKAKARSQADAKRVEATRFYQSEIANTDTKALRDRATALDGRAQSIAQVREAIGEKVTVAANKMGRQKRLDEIEPLRNQIEQVQASQAAGVQQVMAQVSRVSELRAQADRLSAAGDTDGFAKSFAQMQTAQAELQKLEASQAAKGQQITALINKITTINQQVQEIEKSAAKFYEVEINKLEDAENRLANDRRKFEKEILVVDGAEMLGDIAAPRQIGNQIQQRRQSIEQKTVRQGEVKAKAQQNEQKITELRGLLRQAGGFAAGTELSESILKALGKAVNTRQALEDYYKQLQLGIDNDAAAIGSLKSQSRSTIAKDAKAEDIGTQIATLQQKQAEVQQRAIEALQSGDEEFAKKALTLKKRLEKAEQDLRADAALAGVSPKMQMAAGLVPPQIAVEATKKAEVDAPIEYLKLARKVTGKNEIENLPRIEVADEALAARGAEATYSIEGNVVKITTALKQALDNAELTSEQAVVLAEELSHAFDFDFGSEAGLAAFNRGEVIPDRRIEPTKDELRNLATDLSNYPEQRRGMELNAKARAGRAANAYLGDREKEMRLTRLSDVQSAANFNALKAMHNETAAFAKQLGEFDEALHLQRRASILSIYNDMDAILAATATGDLAGSDLQAAITVLGKKSQEIQQGIEKRAEELLRIYDIQETEANLDNPWESAPIPEKGAAALIERNAARTRGTRQIGDDPWKSKEEIRQERIQRGLTKAKARATKVVQGAKDAIFNPDREITIDMDKMRDRVEKTGIVLYQGGLAIAKTMDAANSALSALAQSDVGQLFLGGLGQATAAIGGVAKASYALAAGMESIALDLTPGGRMLKGALKQTAVPALAFGAATHFLPGGQMVAGAMGDFAQSALSPIGHSIAGNLSGGAVDLIGQAVPNIMGLQTQIAGAVSGAIEGAVSAATSGVAAAAVPILGGKAIQTAAGKALPQMTLPQSNQLALPSAKNKALAGNTDDTQMMALPPAQRDLRSLTKKQLEAIAKQNKVNARGNKEAIASRLEQQLGYSKLDPIIASIDNVIDRKGRAVSGYDEAAEAGLLSKFSSMEKAIREKLNQLKESTGKERQRLLDELLNSQQTLIGELEKTKSQALSGKTAQKLGQMQGRVEQTYRYNPEAQEAKRSNSQKITETLNTRPTARSQPTVIDVSSTTLERKKSQLDGLDAENIGKNITSGITGGMNADAVAASASDLAQAAINAAEDTLEIKSPSRVFARIGRFIVEGLRVGINQAPEIAADVKAKLENLEQQVNDAAELKKARIQANLDDLGNQSAANSAAKPKTKFRDTLRREPRLNRGQQDRIEMMQTEIDADSYDRERNFAQYDDLSPDAAEAAMRFDAAYAKVEAKIERGANTPKGKFAALLTNLMGENPTGALGLASKGLIFLAGNIGTVVAAFAAMPIIGQAIGMLRQFGGAAIQAAIAADKLNTSLNFTTRGKAKETIAFADATAERLGVSRSAAIDGMARISAAGRGKISEADQRELMTGLSMAGTTFGMNQEEMSGSNNAIAQMLSKGKVQAEELRGQLGERLPGAFGIAARSMGMSEEELNKQLELGNVSAKDFVPKFAKQLQAEFGAGAEEAGKNLQSSLIRLENALERLKIASGNAIAPAFKVAVDAAAIGVNALSKAMEILGKIMPALVGAGTVMLIGKLGGLGAILGNLSKLAVGAIGSMGGFAGLGAKLLPALSIASKFLLKMLLVQGAIEAVSSTIQMFRPDEMGSRFEKMSNDIANSLKKIREEADKTNQSVNEIGKTRSGNKSMGFDFTLGMGGMFGLENGYRSDDLLTGINAKFGTEFGTVADMRVREGNDRIMENAYQISQAGVMARDPKLQAELAKAREIDEKDTALAQERAKLSASPTSANREAISAIDKQRSDLANERQRSTKTAREIGKQLDQNVNNLRDALQANEADKNISEDVRKFRRNEIQAQLNDAQRAQREFRALESTTGAVADRVMQFKNALSELGAKLEDVSRNTENAFNAAEVGRLQKSSGRFKSDSEASMKDAEESASNQARRAQSEFEGQQKLINEIQSKLQAPEVQKELARIPIAGTGRMVSTDSSLADLELAKKGLTDESQKDLIDKVIEYRKSKDSLPSFQKNALEAQLQERETKQRNAFERMDRKSQQRDLTNKTSETADAINLNNKIGLGQITDTQADIERAKMAAKSARAQKANIDEQLASLENYYQQGLISAEEYEKRKRDLHLRGLDAVKQISEAELQVRQAANRKALDDFERSNRRRDLKVKKADAADAINIAQMQMDNRTLPEDVEIAKSQATLRSTDREASSLNAQAAGLKSLREQGVLDANQYADRMMEIEGRMTDLTVRQAEARLAAQQAANRKALEDFEQAARQRESINKRMQASEQISLLQRRRNKDITSEDAAIEQQDVNLRSTAREDLELSNKRRDLELKLSRGLINRRDYGNQKRELDDQQTEIRVKREEQLTSRQDAVDSKAINAASRQAQEARMLGEMSISQRLGSTRLLQANRGILTGEGGQQAVDRIESDATKMRIAAIQDEIAANEELFANRNVDEIAYNQKSLELATQLQQEKAKLIDLEIKQREYAAQAATDAVKRQTDEIIMQLDREKGAIDGVIKLAQDRQSLLSTQLELARTSTEARTSTLEIGSSRASEAADIAGKLQDPSTSATLRGILQKQLGELGYGSSTAALSAKVSIEAEIGAEKLAGLKEQQKLEEKILELKIAQERSAAKNAVLEAQKNQYLAQQQKLQADLALTQAKMTGDRNQIANAEMAAKIAESGVGIAAEQLQIARKSAEMKEQEFGMQREIASMRNASDAAKLQAETGSRRRSAEREFGEAAAKLEAKQVVVNNGTINNGSVTNSTNIKSSESTSHGGASRYVSLDQAWQNGATAWDKGFSRPMSGGAAGAGGGSYSYSTGGASGLQTNRVVGGGSTAPQILPMRQGLPLNTPGNVIQTRYEPSNQTNQQLVKATNAVVPTDRSAQVDKAVAQAGADRVVKAIDKLGDKVENLANKPRSVSVSSPAPADDLAKVLNTMNRAMG